MLTISQLAKEIGVCVETLRRWDKSGSVKPHIRTPGGHRRYVLAEVMLTLGSRQALENHPDRVVVGYSRVSSHDQKDDLIKGFISKMLALASSIVPRRTPVYCLVTHSSPPCPLAYEPFNIMQTERLRDRLKDESRAILIEDLGSGLNFQKRGLCKLLKLITAGRVERLVVTHKDRLLRFGYELLEKMVAAHGGTIEILEYVAGNDDMELAKDVLTFPTALNWGGQGARSKKSAVYALVNDEFFAPSNAAIVNLTQ